MDHCKALKLDLIGVSYHVGSGCTDIPTYLSAVHLARRTFDEADKRGFKFTLLDIGGGWYAARCPKYSNSALFNFAISF
jgi:ornithine decarboxylase